MESSKKLRCAWIVWNIVFYGLMIPWSVFVVTGGTAYWGGRFYPFEYNPWINVGLVFGTLQAAVFLVIVHGVLLLMKQRKRSLFCHALALVLIILCTQPGFKMYIDMSLIPNSVQQPASLSFRWSRTRWIFTTLIAE